jgi:SAM-dependent methyltransferase
MADTPNKPTLDPGRGDAAPAPRADVVFSATSHLQMLLRVDRALSVQKAVRAAVKPGARVLDAGCGSGILTFLALQAGAAEAVAVDRDNIALARALAQANGYAAQIRFIETDLASLDVDQVAGRVDVLLAFVYTNHVVVDEPRTAMVAALRQRVGAPDCRMRPQVAGERGWMPGPSHGGYKYRRGAGRFLGQRTAVAEIAYDRAAASAGLPRRLELEIRTPGTFNAIMWGQELWFGDFLIWSSEALSPLRVPVAARAGERWAALLDADWRARNAVTVERNG